MLGQMLTLKGIKAATTLILLGSSIVVDAASPYYLEARKVSVKNKGANATLPVNSTAPATKPNSTDKYKHDGLDPSLNPWFSASGDWLTKSCLDDDFSGKTIDPAGSYLWQKAGADSALLQLIAAWNTRPDNVKSWTFSRFVWSVFNVTGGNTQGAKVDCSDPFDVLCSISIKCDPSTGIPPAGYLIVNSMVALHDIYQMQHNGLNDAYNSISGAMQFVSTNFDWTPAPSKDEEILKAILGFAMAALGAVSGGTISEALTAIKVLGKVTEKTATTMKTVASNGLSLTNKILDSLPPPAAQGDILGDLNAILSGGYNGLASGTTAMLESLADAQGQANQSLLFDFMNTGVLLDYSNQNTNNTEDIKNKAVSMMYGQIIPAAWGLSVDGLRPFILRMDAKDHKCGDALPSAMADYFDKDVAKNALWCDASGNSFWLLNGIQQEPCTTRFCTPNSKKPFGLLPGGNITNLDGTNWGGLHLGDIIRSSWGGFMANNKQNGYSIPKGTDQQVAANMTLQGSNGLPMAGGVLTPGFFNFTICLDYTEALKNLRSSDKKAAICGTSPSPGGSVTDMNAPGQYTPGWCRLHATQYQRREGNLNPLDVYQLDVNIFDSASLQVGDATKQPAGSPLAIPGSLPYQLIVAPGAGDDDPLSFWYSDQYWTSDDKNHQCSQGKFDGGKREIDCGFQCPLPASSAPVSATKDHALPGAPTPAVAGANTYINTYITATPTPTPSANAPPPPKPTPTYATGWCGLHVRQHQKNEKGSNPTNDYAIEATIFDAKQKAIGSSGQVQAPDNKAVTVNGLVSPFTVTAFNLDSDGLRFSFNGNTFWSNSSACSVGKYDSGARDMDCGFTC